MNEHKTITINEYEVPVREYNGQRVITFKDIDNAHERKDGTARKRFNDNREHFIEGTDFFIINQPSEIRTLGFQRPQGGTPESVILISESGYLMLVKSFTDNLAWEVQRTLINSYFRIKEVENSYSAKSTSVGEIATMIKTLRSVMKDQKSNPVKIAVMAEGLCQQFGIAIPHDFVEKSPWEQMEIGAIN